MFGWSLPLLDLMHPAFVSFVNLRGGVGPGAVEREGKGQYSLFYKSRVAVIPFLSLLLSSKKGEGIDGE